VQAVDVDTGTPDILSSVSSGLVQTLTKAESAEVRGERVCFGIPNIQQSNCSVAWSSRRPQFNLPSPYVVEIRPGRFGGYWVSR